MRWGPLCGRNLLCLESRLAKTPHTTATTNNNKDHNHCNTNNNMTMSEEHGRHVRLACGNRWRPTTTKNIDNTQATTNNKPTTKHNTTATTTEDTTNNR